MKQRTPLHIDEFLKQGNVVSDAEAEQADVVICVPEPGSCYVADDVRALCASCGKPIKHRLHAPNLPMKVCVHCGLRMLAEDSLHKQQDA